MKPAVREVNKTQFLTICIHKATINYINDKEDSPVFFLIILFYLDHKQFMKISN